MAAFAHIFVTWEDKLPLLYRSPELFLPGG